MSAQPAPSLESILARQTAGRTRIRTRVLSVVEQTWGGLGSWDSADVERFVAKVEPLIRAGQLSTAAMTDSYIAAVMSTMTGEPVRPIGVHADEVTHLRPVPNDEVYRRPFVELWSGLKTGQPFNEALAAGGQRALRLVEDDLSMAHRTAASRAFTQHSGVQTYRRVIRPEMSKTGVCGLCIAASGQTYKSETLLPVHGRCWCDVLPIVGSMDPGRTINGEDIDSLYARAASQADSLTGKDLKKVRIDVYEHGELGPTLRVAGQDFTGPLDIAA